MEMLMQLRYLLWGPFTILLMLATGIYMTIRSKFVQFWCFPAIIKQFRKYRRENSGGISPWQALCTSLGGTLGVGNLVGVAVAVRLGGPGAVFYMILAAFFGMATKFAEIVLAVHFQVHFSDGQTIGGPMVYLEKGSGARYLPKLFCIFALIASLGMGSMTQAGAFIQAVKLMKPMPSIYISFLMACLFYPILKRGKKVIAKVSCALVPIMSLLYLAGGIAVLFCYRKQIPMALHCIWVEAAKPMAAGGGLCGIVTSHAIANGFAKGIFSNEAGLGSAPLAHGCVRAKSPGHEGVLGAFEVFLDTGVVCLLTALVLLVTGSTNGTDGLSQTTQAFGCVLGKYSLLFMSAMVCFLSITSILGWGFYGLTCLRYLTSSERAKTMYQGLLVFSVFCSAFFPFDALIVVADIFAAPMAFPNLMALWALAPVVQQEAKQYLQKEKQCRSKKLRHRLK